MSNYNEKKLVSIGLPTFNRAATLKRAVDSLLAQTYKNLELIISDNTSTDDTENICREYAVKDSRVRYFRQQKSIGMVGQFDFLANNFNGDYFMLASDDDWWHEDFILNLKKALDDHPEYGIAMSSLKQVREDGSLVSSVIYNGKNDLSKFNHSQVFNAIVFKQPPAHFFIMGLFRKDVLKNLAWKPNDTAIGGDKILMYEASLFTRFYSIPDVLWVRTSSLMPDADRYSNEYRKVVTDKIAYLKHIGAAVLRLVRSPNISFTKKVTLIPIKIPILIWAYRKHLLRELFPPLFQKYLKYRKIYNRNG